ncbi:ribosomal protein L7/L12 [Bacillus mycoides]|uniref:ribosomal protein L7/L12 n=1 Tax=Bacillus mycoides TaxID=1405 RepID=UPI003F74C891
MEFWMIIPIAVFGFIYIVEKLNRIEKKTDARLKRMEDRLQLITKEMGIIDREPEINKAEINKELRQLMEEGKKVKAIKRVREAFGFSLLEAKQYVDKL